MIKTQNKQLLAAMKKGQKFTAIDALARFGIFRLSGRIYDIKQQLEGTGYQVLDRWVTSTNGKRFKEYRIGRKRI